MITALAIAGEPDAGGKTVLSGESSSEVGIPFVNHGAILDWQVINDETLLLRDRHGQWYKATLVAPAYYLAYSASLRFATGPSGTLDQFGAVIVRGQRFPIKSLTRLVPGTSSLPPKSGSND